MLDATGDIINGFKEIRLNSARSAAAMEAYQSASDRAEAASIASGERWASLILLSSVVTYLMLGMIGFVLPQYMSEHGVTVFELVPTLLFCMGPVARIVAQSPMFLEAEAGLKAIADIERQLDEGGSVSPAEARAMSSAYRDFRELAYRGLTFSYAEQSNGSSFRVGPLDLTVKRGETLFLVGGNGSGKSTALRLLTGLYPAKEGVIEVDSMRVEGRAVAGLRELFSAVFADFHLFDRLYGIENSDPAIVQRLIAEMGLAHKVGFENGRFSQINLSTGQRKRLALIEALAENRPIYIFDEWSAEQDVHFRKYFYTKVLANLKAAGKTVIAVTHDERYWHVADRVVRLDLGKVLWERPGAVMEGRMKAILFPGQGAQRVGMGEELFGQFPQLMRCADDVLGYSLAELCLKGPATRLVDTRFTQPAIYAVGALGYLSRQDRGLAEPQYLLGHSVGEYVALFAAGVFDFETGLRLVKARGELMSAATGGGMAAVLGLDEAQVGAVLERHAGGEVFGANYNTPQQIVISGRYAAVVRLEEAFRTAGATFFKVLDVGGAFHTPFMASAQSEFQRVVERDHLRCRRVSRSSRT